MPYVIDGVRADGNSHGYREGDGEQVGVIIPRRGMSSSAADGGWLTYTGRVPYDGIRNGLMIDCTTNVQSIQAKCSQWSTAWQSPSDNGILQTLVTDEICDERQHLITFAAAGRPPTPPPTIGVYGESYGEAYG